MRVVYDPSGAGMPDATLRARLLAALSDMGHPPAPLVALDLGLPDYPYQIDAVYLTDDRETQGGVTHSRLRAVLRRGELNFSSVHTDDVAAWRAWYAATQGFRRPFAVELPDGQTLLAAAPANRFPLILTSLESWEGSLSLREFP